MSFFPSSLVLQLDKAEIAAKSDHRQAPGDSGDEGEITDGRIGQALELHRRICTPKATLS
jgi:hypothetical protein